MNIQSVVKMHSRDKWAWFFIPNIILFSVFLLNFIVSLLISSDEKMYTGGVSYIFFYMLVMGIIIVVQTYPYAIGMSIRRTDYFFGTVVMGVAVNILYGIMLVLLAAIENATNGWGERVHFFHFPYLNDGTLLEQLIVYIILLINLFCIGLLISSTARRFGAKGLVIAIISLLLISSVAALFVTYYGVWMDIFQWFVQFTAVQIAYWLILPTLLYMMLSYALLKRATV
ncbi:hypothetical protein RRV45_06660 [Bacillus sp. DTU_2020_1000418_1_SI_GHA_SEK_038]|uniref:hypothetical protein n=1 Tax=Bacillus sp. DTU_2020_1000418_1_SI_GHA_SEK_038 TaxID=3077585 RepID=UPI0028E1F2FA|nr:hypothetical protein [Bacillus sp. DTU_2020_1000418_1_SI_GHA_SEK_038]WNS76663.1 hypothetical protein RRV45_06660 [Bacillus sp. DTU_2020_1000418_1_SI_GHA_SEK_038]